MQIGSSAAHKHQQPSHVKSSPMWRFHTAPCGASTLASCMLTFAAAISAKFASRQAFPKPRSRTAVKSSMDLHGQDRIPQSLHGHPCMSQYHQPASFQLKRLSSHLVKPTRYACRKQAQAADDMLVSYLFKTGCICSSYHVTCLFTTSRSPSTSLCCCLERDGPVTYCMIPHSGFFQPCGFG